MTRREPLEPGRAIGPSEYILSIKSKISSPAVKTAGFFVLALLLLALFFRGTDMGELTRTLAGANPALLLAALGSIMVTYLLRAIRWRVLLLPLGRARLVNCFTTTVIGFMVNFLVPPGRLGEIARPYLLARREGFSASSAFATIILERFLDLVAVVSLIGFWLFFGPARAGSEEAVAVLKVGGLIGLGTAVVALAVMFSFARFPERSLAWSKRILGILPKKAESAMGRFVETFTAGLGVLVDATGVAIAVGLSIALWINVCWAFWLGARALGVDFGFGDTFLVIGFLTVGVAVPTPGAIGGYHVLCALALTMLFQTDASVAKAVALVNHAIAFLPVTFLGILLFAKAGLSFKTITSSS
jgi:uncharacterized protein (TIRG00374 family)